MSLVLVVEDNENNLDLLVRILDANGYETLSATNGEDGIKVAAEVIPDLILMDIQMPGIDGYEALEAIRNQSGTRAIPIIAVTGNATEYDRARAREAGFQSFIAKPYKIDHLLEEIDLTLSNGAWKAPRSNEKPVAVKETGEPKEVKVAASDTSVIREFEVSCRAASMFFSFYEENGFPLDELVKGTEFDLAHWLDPAQRVHWDNFRRLLANVTDRCDGQKIEELGHRNVFESWSQPFVVLSRTIFNDPIEIYRWFLEPTTGVGNLVVQCLEQDLLEVSDGVLEIRQRLRSDLEVSEPYLRYSCGVLSAIPELLYRPRANVRLEIRPDEVIYHINFKAAGSAMSWLRHKLYSLISARLIVHEIHRGYVLLQQRFQDMSLEIQRRQLAETTLKQSEEKFRTLIEHGEDLVLIVDANLHATYMSPHLRRLMDVSDEELPAYYQHHEPDFARQLLELIGQVANTPGKSVQGRIRTDSETGLNLLEGYVTNHMHSPGIEGYVFELRDRTQRYKLEQRIEQTNRMEAVGRLASGVAHDFNNLLQIIDGRAQLALRGDYDKAEALKEILRSSESAGKLTRELLTIGRESDFKLARLDAVAWLRDREPFFRVALPRNIELKIRHPDNELLIKADGSRLEQLLLNLVINAADAIEHGHGAVTIELAAVDSQLVIRLSDNGSGMEEETKRRAFDPFFTTKADQGNGLGLASAFAIIQQHQGSIDLESTPGYGSTFTIKIPLIA